MRSGGRTKQSVQVIPGGNITEGGVTTPGGVTGGVTTPGGNTVGGNTTVGAGSVIEPRVTVVCTKLVGIAGGLKIMVTLVGAFVKAPVGPVPLVVPLNLKVEVGSVKKRVSRSVNLDPPTGEIRVGMPSLIMVPLNPSFPSTVTVPRVVRRVALKKFATIPVLALFPTVMTPPTMGTLTV